jgi:hypothetical protein
MEEWRTGNSSHFCNRNVISSGIGLALVEKLLEINAAKVVMADINQVNLA